MSRITGRSLLLSLFTLILIFGVAGGAETVTVVVTAGPATKLAFIVQPSDADATIAISPPIKVQVQDANGNLVSTATDLISLALANNLSGATFSGTFTDVAPDNGEATFSDISIDKAQNEYFLIASATGGLTSAVSASFNITVRPDPAGGRDRE